MDEVETELIYVWLPEGLMPIDRGDLYEDPIDDQLQAADLGYVSGGGSSLGEARPDGTRLVEACGVDVETHDLDQTLDALRNIFPKLKCPVGTQLQYGTGDVPLHDEFDGTSWAIGQPREKMHPGFDA